MKAKTEITVAITTYNLEKYIARCLDDLFSQTMQDFDILIYDDASDDGTVQIIQSYAERFPDRVRCIPGKENCGSPSRSRNKILDSGLIQGNYIVFLDGDDRLEPNFLEALHNSAILHNADICVCAYDRVSVEDGHIICKEMHSFPDVVTFPEDCSIIPLINGSLWNKLIKTSLLSDLRLPDFSVGEDLCFLHRLYMLCARLAFIDNELIHYQVRSESVISNTSEDTIRRFAREFSDILSSCGDAFSDEEALSCFIHIGISMAIRAYQNPHINIRQHLRWTRQFLVENRILYGNRSLKFGSLLKMGIRGFAIWCCKLLYICRCFTLFLWLYSAYTNLCGKDVKF